MTTKFGRGVRRPKQRRLPRLARPPEEECLRSRRGKFQYTFNHDLIYHDNLLQQLKVNRKRRNLPVPPLDPRQPSTSVNHSTDR